MNAHDSATFSLKRFFIQANAVLLALLALGVALLGHTILSLNRSNDDADRLRRVAETMAHVAFDVVQVQQFLTDVAATHEPGGHDEARRHYESAKKGIESLARSAPENSAEWTALAQEIDAMYAGGQEMARAYIENGLEAGNAIMKRPGDGFDARAARLTGHIGTLKQKLNPTHQQAEEQLDADVERMSLIGSVILGALLLVLPAFSFFVYSRVKAEVGGDLPMAAAIADRLSLGELDMQIDVAPGQEGSLVAHMGKMRHRWTDVVSGLRGHAHLLAQTSTETARRANAMVTSSGEQSASVNDIGGTLSELSGRINLIAESAAEANAKVGEAGQRAQSGADLVTALAQDMDAIAHMINQSAEQAHQLDHRANDIQGIVSAIREIADQTNLLALNAAIEAARAGEQGRGFAVVADEVRKLAERTTASTGTIAELIEQVHHTTSQIVDTIQNSVERVGGGMERMAKTSSEMRDVVTFSDEVAARVGMIDLALREQRNNIQLVSGRAQEIVGHAADNADSANALATQSEALQRIAEALQSEVAFFKTGAAGKDGGDGDLTLF